MSTLETPHSKPPREATGEATGVAPAGTSIEVPDEELLDPHTRMILASSQRDNKLLRWAIAGAVVFHAVLLLVTFPDWSSPKRVREAGPKKVYKMQQVVFKPPAAAPRQEIPKRRSKKIPIPDPTPDEPEPIVVDEIVDPTVDLPPVDVAVFGIPEAPPSVGDGLAEAAVRMGSGITPPVKIFFPDPGYTEEARQARIQGSVIVDAVIDKEGNVHSVQVLKGLPLGLDKRAIDAVKTWKFKPATEDGEAIAVYFTLIINFSLQ